LYCEFICLTGTNLKGDDMTIINNFDTSSTGINIEFNGRYDTYLSRINFEESFNICEELGYGCLIHNTGDDIKSVYELFSIPENKSVRDILKALLTYYDNPRDLISDCWWYVGYTRELSKDDINGFVRYCLDNEECLEFIKDNYTTEYDDITVTGFSQGDIVTVWYNTNHVKGDISTIREQFTNIIFGTEIHGMLTINDKEYYITDYLKDYYWWDKDSFINSFMEFYNGDSSDDNSNEYIRTWLEDNLPSHLDYI